MNTLVALWCMLLAADRVDVFAGAGPFVLTPFLLLTPLVVLSAIWARARAGEPLAQLQLEGRAPLLRWLLLALIAVVTLSVFVSMDVSRSAMRAMQLVVVAFGAFAVRALVPHDRLREALVRGARWGIVFYAVMALFQVAALLGVIPDRLPSAALPMVKLMPSLHGGLVPRLSGPVVDSNRSGLLLVLYGALLMRHDWRRHVGMLALAALFLLITLSRSAVMAACVALCWEVLVHGRLRGQAALRHGLLRAPSRAVLGVGVVTSLVVGGVAASLLLSPRLRAEASRVLTPVTERFTINRGSGEDHLRLLARGVETGTRSVPLALHGMGYGSAHLALQDFFPGDRYGNFHSVYVGIFAESGMVALLVVLLLIGVPIAAGTSQGALAVVVAVFGVFYSALAEPTFWVSLVLAWLPLEVAVLAVSGVAPNPGWRSARPKASSNATAVPSTAPRTS